ncbi:MAG: cob(I)yrinic acid a,c-diamide adenosyltransferase [Candidatus Latescibacterota bacterium]
MKGYIQVYTGDGKGKTTAALGLALRAAGAGLRVYIIRFMKGTESSENAILERVADLITVRQYGSPGFVEEIPGDEDFRFACEGWEEAERAVNSGEYDMVILDEANVAVHFGLFPLSKLLNLMDRKPENVELVITGRKADKRVIERADIVTEMCEIKHYYHKGVPSRKGIES